MKKILCLLFCVAMCATAFPQKNARAFASLFYDALSYMYEDNYDIALLLWQEAETYDPQNPNLWYNLGVCYETTSKDREKAVSYLEKALDYVEADYEPNNHKVRSVPLDCHLHYATALRQLGKYDESIRAFRTAKKIGIENNNLEMQDKAEEGIEISNNAKLFSLQKSCNLIEVTNLGDVINTKFSDHSPAVVCSGDVLYFTSKRSHGVFNLYGYENIYVTKKGEDGWSEPKLLPNHINTNDCNESVVSVSSDGKQLYFFRSSPSTQGNLYLTELNDLGEWSKPQALSYSINSKYRETHIAIAPDGNSVYFTSDRPGGYGGLDIYVIKKLPNNKWTEPQLLPREVNTNKDEECPFVHPNGSILYFSSKGHNSVGGYDVFFSTINEDGTYSKAESMCSPINTSDNDVSYTISCDGVTAYIAAIREDSKGEYDIYQISDKGLDENVVAYEGYIFYADGAVPKSVRVWVKDKNNGEDVGSYEVNDKSGKYTCVVQKGNEYRLTYSKNGSSLCESAVNSTTEDSERYVRSRKPLMLDTIIIPFFNKSVEIYVTEQEGLSEDATSILANVASTNSEFKDEERKLYINLEYDGNLDKDSPQIQSIIEYLTSNGINYDDITYNNPPKDANVFNVRIHNTEQPLADKGSEITLPDDTNLVNPPLLDTVYIKNVYFDFDKYNIKAMYKENLDELAKFMNEYPAVKIEIGGHTDAIGTDEYNIVLSDRRARAVKNYLVSKGVKQDKIETQKFGERQPATDNNSSLSRAKNRRAIFRVLVQSNEKYLKIVDDIVLSSNYYSNSATANATSSKAAASTASSYRVQIFSLTKKKELSDLNIPDLKMAEFNGMYRYYFGNFSTYSEAQNKLNEIISKYPNAIIIENR
ncbi:MAG: PD40 domain-containing protein [Bacteroidales bacterium]|nr:PD40 domain-containing protein [Bacteroidales bacterium]